MVCLVAFNEDVVNVATPPAVVPVPMVVDPTPNVTAPPSGIAPYLDVTVAEKVTACPTTEGDPVVLSLFFVATGGAATTSLTFPKLDLYDEFPRYEACMSCVPATNPAVVKLTTPLAVVIVPIGFVPSKNVPAPPSGTAPIVESLLSTNVTAWPLME